MLAPTPRFFRAARWVPLAVPLAAGLLSCALPPAPDPPSGAVEDLVASGSLWRYLDDGSDPGTEWREPGFDDGAWSEGRALLGYGVGDESTQLRCHPEVEAGECPEDRKDRTLAYFLRRRFEVDRPERFTRIRLRLIKDDGAIVYLNGEMVARANMRPGVVGQGNPAAGEVADRLVWREYRFDHRKLKAGENLLAVELHQASAKGKSVGFDLELVGFDPRATAVRRGPYLQLLTERGVTIRWETGDAVASELRWGTDPEALDEARSFETLTTRHKIRLDGLEPATTYYYRVAAGERALGSRTHRFRTAPAAGGGTPVRVWVMGGAGTGDRFAQRTALAFEAFAGETPLDVWLTVGDHAFDKGSEEQFDRGLFSAFPGQLASHALWPSLGNTDRRTGKTEETIPYFGFFNLPSEAQAGGQPSGSEAYYSFDYGDVHFVSLDTVAGNLSPDKEMLTWLAEDLAQNESPWTIAYFHHPPYSDGWLSSDDADKSGRSFGVRQNVLPILEKAGVDVVLSGRNPSYERSRLLHGHYETSDKLESTMVLDAGDGREDGDGAYRKARRGKGAVYVVTGGAARSVKGEFTHPVMAVGTEQRGSVVIDVAATRLDLRYLTSSGEVFDHVTLVQR